MCRLLCSASLLGLQSMVLKQRKVELSTDLISSQQQGLVWSLHGNYEKTFQSGVRGSCRYAPSVPNFLCTGCESLEGPRARDLQATYRNEHHRKCWLYHCSCRCDGEKADRCRISR